MNTLPPIIASEPMRTGWRGLTEVGEVLNVSGGTLAWALDSEEITCVQAGKVIGVRAMPAKKTRRGVIERYIRNCDQALRLHRANRHAEALAAIDHAIGLAPTLIARFNRALILLARGRWEEGFAEYIDCERHEPFMRPMQRKALARGLAQWRGEPLVGKRLLLVHDHGFGDSIQALRYVPVLRAMGADVVLLVPAPLERLAAQCAPVVSDLVDADFFCPLLYLLRLPNPTTAPYLTVDKGLQAKWRVKHAAGRHRIGIAWDVGNRIEGDFPRAIPRTMLTEKFADADLVPVQQDPAAPFIDFADCAALMSVLDEIVTVDTAALHVAGAIGHRKITVLLSHWHSWRFQRDWYSNVRLCRQPKPGDWAGALAQC